MNIDKSLKSVASFSSLSIRHPFLLSLKAILWGVKLEQILRHVILTLLDQPKATFADIVEILLDKEFGRNVLLNVKSE